MNIVEKLRLMQTDHIPELGEAISEIEHLRREAHTWSKACEAATTKLHKLSTPHPRLEVRYWTGEYWEPLHGALFYAALDALFTVPTTEIQEAEQIYAEELLQAHTRDLERLERFEDWLADRTGPVLSLEEVRDAIKPFADLIHTTDGPIPTERLSLANWHELVNAYDA